jgi:hypothetical protein
LPAGFDSLGSRVAKQHRLVGRLDDRAQAGERHRLVVNLDLAEIDQPLDEPAQPEFLEVDLCCAGSDAVHLPRSRKRFGEAHHIVSRRRGARVPRLSCGF